MSAEKFHVSTEKPQTSKALLMPNSWQTTIDFIKYLALENNVMPVILGEQGSGKTAFSHLLHAELNPHMQTYMIAGGPLFNRVFFLQQLKDVLGIVDEFSLTKLIHLKNEQKSHMLLIIDDAQFLATDFIEELLRELRQQGSTGYFHVCLISDFSLVPILNKLAEETFKDAIHSIELGALSESETKTYLLQHLAMRNNVEKLVTDARVKLFYQLTAGHFMDIHRQMIGFFGDLKVPSKQGQFRWPMAVSLVVLVTTGYILTTKYYLTSPTLNQAVIVANADKKTIHSQVEPLLLSSIPSYEWGALRQAIVATPIRRADLIVASEEDETMPMESMGVVDKVIVAPKIMSTKEGKIKSVPVVPAEKKKISTAAPSIETNLFTIQLLASHNKKKLQYFANAHHLKGKVQLRRSLNQGVAWYVLTLGEYSQRQLAQEAANKLPKEIVNYKPWVRAIADFKAAG